MIDIFDLADRPFAIAHACNYRYVGLDITGEDAFLELKTTYKCDCGKERIEIYNQENTAINIPTYKLKLLNERK
ncbi:MAG: hypothetical protein QM660_10950 [Dysgonomonas sp.]